MGRKMLESKLYRDLRQEGHSDEESARIYRAVTAVQHLPQRRGRDDPDGAKSDDPVPECGAN